MKLVHLCLGSFFIDHYSYQENLLPKYHVKMGYEVTVIASLMSFDSNGKGCYLEGPSEYEDENGFHVIRLAYKAPIVINKKLQHYIGLEQKLNEIQPDIIFMHGAGIGDSSIVASFLKRNPNVLLFADSHADYYNSGKNWLSLKVLNGAIRRSYHKRLDKYIIKEFGVTPWRCDFLVDVYGANRSKVEYLPMGVDDESIPHNKTEVRDRIRKELKICAEDFVVFTGGKIDSQKNIQYLLQAIKSINDDKIHVIICGVVMPQMETVITPLLSDNVHYLGWCDAARVMDCMVSSDIACFPGTHSTLWEQSVGVGLPIIYKHWNKMDHVNVEGNAVALQGENSEEIVKAITHMRECIDDYKEKAVKASKFFLYSEIAKRAIGL